MNNPYSTPEASIDVDPRVATYQPRFLALNGRIGRVRYFAYNTGLALLVYAVIFPLLLLTGISGAMFGDPAAAGGANPIVAAVVGLLMIALYVALLVMMIGYTVRRLNDLGKTGWLALLLLIPLANLVLWIYVVFFPGQKGVNQYGPAPAANTAGVIALAVVGVVAAVIGVVGGISLVSSPAYQSYLEQVEKAQKMQQ
ncbi:MAG: DUF805 domain-containing protein [Alcanivoracaceae bacterium]|jgi:uncharacterized membrane protein YhaH (DUF805 family)|nr:DUF805 domain-containing protein [Alcanivoracaceae bacterium]